MTGELLNTKTYQKTKQINQQKLSDYEDVSNVNWSQLVLTDVPVNYEQMLIPLFYIYTFQS